MSREGAAQSSGNQIYYPATRFENGVELFEHLSFTATGFELVCLRRIRGAGPCRAIEPNN
jgi:hypothetical protein